MRLGRLRHRYRFCCVSLGFDRGGDLGRKIRQRFARRRGLDDQLLALAFRWRRQRRAAHPLAELQLRPVAARRQRDPVAPAELRAVPQPQLIGSQFTQLQFQPDGQVTVMVIPAMPAIAYGGSAAEVAAFRKMARKIRTSQLSYEDLGGGQLRLTFRGQATQYRYEIQGDRLYLTLLLC
jgi:hypothetical protein